MTDEHPAELGVNEMIRSFRGGPGWRRFVLQQSAKGAFEFGMLALSPVFRNGRAPGADGHSVLVIPGFSAGDLHMSVLRGWLRRLGYRAPRSGISANPCWSEEIVSDLARRVDEEFERSGMKVSLIRHSLGGLQARSVALRRPDRVRRVIALGAALMFAGGTIPPSVAIRSIYVPSDLDFRPKATEPHAENFLVRGSHAGLAFNRTVYELIAEALSVPDGAVKLRMPGASR